MLTWARAVGTRDRQLSVAVLPLSRAVTFNRSNRAESDARRALRWAVAVPPPPLLWSRFLVRCRASLLPPIVALLGRRLNRARRRVSSPWSNRPAGDDDDVRLRASRRIPRRDLMGHAALRSTEGH